MELWFLFFEARCRHIGLYIPDELRRSISAPSAEGRWPGEDPALNKGPTPLPTALPGLLPQGGSSSLGFPPYNRFEFKQNPTILGRSNVEISKDRQMEFTLNGLTIMKKDGEGNTKYLSQGRWVKICE